MITESCYNSEPTSKPIISNMNETRFHQIVDATLMQIEDILDTADSDLDYVNSAGMLTITGANGSQIIFSRQLPLVQLWLACQAGGFHFDYNDNEQHWQLDSDAGMGLDQLLSQALQALQAQTGEMLDCSELG